MTYFPSFGIKAADSPSIDAFGRLRVSEPSTIFDSKQLWDKAADVWDEAITGAGTTSAHTANQSAVNMAVSATTAGSIHRQTFRRFNYQPGKSQLAFLTANIVGLEANVTKQVGVFDSNNGLFFQFTDVASVVIRSFTSGSAVDTAVAQSSWNIDKMDGTGASGITLDWTKAQIFVIDFEWLGVGRVRYGVVIDGLVYYVHQTSAANSGTLVYMTTPNLPVSYKIENDGSGGATSMDHICSSIITEGGVEPTGKLQSITTVAAGMSHTSPNVNMVFALRLASDHLDAVLDITGVSNLGTNANDLMRVQLIRNPTIAGAASWDTTTYDEVDVFTGTPGTSTVTNGQVLGTVVGPGRQIVATASPDPTVSIGSAIDGTSDVVALVVTALNNATIHHAMNWQILR